METSIDLYADDNGDENIEEQEQQAGSAAEDIENENEENQDKEDEEKKTVKPKRVIKNPRPKLNAETLKGRKGLLCLEGYFKNKEYKGRGHEEEDLRYIMKTYEYWCHRLFPKFSFDDCLSKLEKLGTKKEVQTYMKRIRMDLIFDEEQPIRSDDDEDQPLHEEPVSNFDNIVQEDPFARESTGLTEEQMERIRLNKEKASRLLQERMLKQNSVAVPDGVSQNSEEVSGENAESTSQMDNPESIHLLNEDIS